MSGKMNLRIFLALTIGVISVSFAAIFIRFCDDVPALVIAAYRLVIASVILLPYTLMKGVRFRSLDRRVLGLGILGGFFLAMHFVTWISSLKYTSVASSVVLVTTNPIFVGVFSWAFLKEKQSGHLVAGIVLSFFGSLVLALGDGGFRGFFPAGPRALFGDGLALIGAVMASGYLIVGSKIREKLDVLTHISLVYPLSALFIVFFCLATGQVYTGYRPSSYLFLFLLAIVPQLMGHTAFNWSLKHLKASMVAITILGEPIGATILAYFFFRETVGTTQLAGIALIFTAIITASRRSAK